MEKKKSMYHYITGNQKLYAAYVVLLVINSVTGVFFAFVLSEILDCAAGEGMYGYKAGQMERLYKSFLFGMLFLGVSVGSGFGYGKVKNRILYHARRKLKEDLFEGIMARKVREFEKRDMGEYLNDLTGNLNLFEELYFRNVLDVPMVALAFVTAVAACAYIEPLMLFLILAVGLLTAFAVKKTGKRLEKSTGRYTEEAANYASLVKDDFLGYRLIAQYAISGRIKERHAIGNRFLEEAKRANADDRLIFGSVNECIGLSSTILIMAAAAFFAIRGEFSAGIVLAFGQLSGKIISPIMSASDTWVRFRSAKAIREKFDTLLERKEGEKADARPAVYGDIVVKKLSFSFSDKEIFTQFSMEFEKDRKYLLTGESGCGKSTLLNIISGLYDDYEGEVSIGGTEQRKIGRSALAGMVGYVSQDVFFFHDTLRANITLYGDYSEERIWEAVSRCGLIQWIQELPQGLDTQITENGNNLSGGERQRINLARALLKDSRILLLDEISANLDPETTESVENTILSLEGKLVISVAHKMPGHLADRYDVRVRVD